MAFRRTRRLGRRLAAASSPGSSQASSVPSGSLEDDDFQDPPRHWGRIGALVGVWALLLGGGAWFAPAFASGGGDEGTDPRDEDPTDPINAAGRYLRFSSGDDLDRANAVVCDDAEPQVTPEDLLAIRDEYSDALGGLSGTDVSTEEPVITGDGFSIDGTVSYISGGERRLEEFTITVQEIDGEFCVSNAIRVNEPEDDGTGEPNVDSETVATEYLRAIFVKPVADTAEDYQCADYNDIAISEIEQAIADWETANTVTDGEASGRINELQPIESGEATESEVFEATVQLRGLTTDVFTFKVGVEGDCVASFEEGTPPEGGETLIAPEDD